MATRLDIPDVSTQSKQVLEGNSIVFGYNFQSFKQIFLRIFRKTAFGQKALLSEPFYCAKFCILNLLFFGTKFG